MNLTICCATCGMLNNCQNACECENMMDPHQCPDAEVNQSEITAFQTQVPDTLKKITDLVKLKKQLDDQEKELKVTIQRAMERYGVKSFENDWIKMVYVAPTSRETVDTKTLKKHHPDLVEQYTKISPVSASVRVTLKGWSPDGR
jgi:predicted phage-related endonuclease